LVVAVTAVAFTEQNTYVGYWPDSETIDDFGAAFFEGPSHPPQYVMNGSGPPSFEMTLVQVQVRSRDYITARGAAMDIYFKLGGLTNVDLNVPGLTIQSIMATQRPYLLRRDDKLRPYFSCTYEVMKTPDPVTT
jgi:hypothetical protein